MGNDLNIPESLQRRIANSGRDTLVVTDELTEMLGIKRSDLKRMIRDGFAPRPFRLGGANFRWFWNDVEECLMKRRLPRRYSEVKTAEIDRQLVPLCMRNISDTIYEYSRHIDPCVYFLVKDSKIVYIGASIRIADRISQHKQKDFDRVLYIRVELERMAAIEMELIRLHKPPLNFVGNPFREKRAKPAMPKGEGCQESSISTCTK